MELDPYLVQETERFFLSIHPEAETRGEAFSVRQLRGISLLRAVSSGSDTEAVRMSPFTHYSRDIYMKMWDECERTNGPVSWGNTVGEQMDLASLSGLRKHQKSSFPPVKQDVLLTPVALCL